MISQAYSYGSSDVVKPIRFIRFSEMAPPHPRKYVVEGVVPKGHTTTIFGDGGSAKSVLVLSAATAIAGGAERWTGRRVQNSDFELDAGEQHRRAYQVARHPPRQAPARPPLRLRPRATRRRDACRVSRRVRQGGGRVVRYRLAWNRP